MKKLLTIVAILATTSAFAGLDDFKVSTVNVEATFTKAQVIKMLAEGNTCIKDGRKTYYASKNITKKHCGKSTKLGLRVIRAKQLELSFYKEMLGFKS